MRLLSILSCTLSLSLTILPFVTFASSNIGDRDVGNSNGVQSRAEHQRVAICRRDPTSLEDHALAKRDTVDGSGSADVTLPSVGASLGNITTKLGNINLTVTNVTISVGDIDISNISIGNITVIVSVPLPGASPVNAFSAFTSGTSISSSTASPTSTVSSTSVTQSATTSTSTGSTDSDLARRQASDSSSIVTVTPSDSATSTATSTSVGVSATVSGSPIDLGVGNVYTEIGNISIEVGHVNVSIGNVNISNVTIGNIFVLVQIGQPDLTGLLSNATSSLASIGA